MNRNEIQLMLENHKSKLYSKFGIINIGIFYGYVRSEEKFESDIDICS